MNFDVSDNSLENRGYDKNFNQLCFFFLFFFFFFSTIIRPLGITIAIQQVDSKKSIRNEAQLEFYL